MKYLKLFEDLSNDDVEEIKEIFQEYADRYVLTYQSDDDFHESPVDNSYTIYSRKYKDRKKPIISLELRFTIHNLKLRDEMSNFMKRLRLEGYETLVSGVPLGNRSKRGGYLRVEIVEDKEDHTIYGGKNESIKSELTEEDLQEVKDIFQEYADKYFLTYTPNNLEIDYRESYPIVNLEYDSYVIFFQDPKIVSGQMWSELIIEVMFGGDHTSRLLFQEDV